MTVLNARLAKLEKAWAQTARNVPSWVPDEELQKVIAGIARNRAYWMPLATAQRIVAAMPVGMQLEDMTDAQLEAWIVVFDTKF